jgi:adenosylhomocysteinase
MDAEGKLSYPLIAADNAKTKFLFENRYGTGQSTMDGIMKSTALCGPLT